MFFFLRLCVLAAIVCALAGAQSLSSLSGTVIDATGGLVPGAKVQIENTSTGAQRSSESDAAGFYSFPQIAPGTYKITTSNTGFQTSTIRDVRVPVNNPVTVNVKLEVGAVSQTVEVRADATQVNTTDATVGNAFGTAQILQLPLEARNVVGLLALQPGVAYIGDKFDSRNGSVNGGKSDQANVTLDGVDVNDQQERTAFTSVLRVTLDSIQEFRVTTTNANAELGRSSGAQVALLTKNGTNRIHGSGYEFHRNTGTTANSFLNNAAGVPRPKLNRNTFGGSLGGPIVRNKLFYFGTFEGRRDEKEGAANRITPTAEFRQGIVQYIRTDESIGRLTPADIRGRIDPLGIGPNTGILQLLQSYPEPNNFSLGDGLNTAGFLFVAPQPLRYNTYIARLDYLPAESGRHHLFLRGNLQNDRELGLPQFPGEPASSVGLANNKGIAAGYDVVLNPTLTGAFRYGFTRQGGERSGTQTASAFTFFTIDNRYGLTQALKQIVPVHHYSQDFTWLKNAHSVQFGAVQRFISNRRASYANSFHSAQARASRLAGAGAGLDVPDLNSRARDPYRNAMANLLGIISTASANYNYDLAGNVQPVGSPVERDFRGREYELYIQDTWRMARGLSVTAGIRWSLMPPVYEANGLQIAPSPSLGAWFDERGALARQGRPLNSVTPLRYVPRDSPGGSELYDFHKKNFAPRFAIAYSPQGDSDLSRFLFGGPGKTSIRAGWGMYYDLFGQSLMRSSDANSFGLQTSITTGGGQFDERTAPRFTGLSTLPASVIPPPPTFTFPIEAAPIFARGSGIDSQIQPPYSMNMTFSIGREFGGGFLVQGSYVGRLSRKSLIQSDVATPADFIDPASGMSHFEAARQIQLLMRAATPVNQVPNIPFWENLWPGAATGTLSATQAVYQQLSRSGPDYITGLEDLDRLCRPACSKYGRFTIFDPQFASFTAWRSIANGSYHAMQWTVRKRFSDGLQFDLNYTWSKSIDLGSRAEYDGAANLGMLPNPWNPALRKAVSDYDMTHQFNANWIAELPFGKGKRFLTNAGGLTNALLGGWQFSGLWRQTSGLPISVANGRVWPTNWQWQSNATQTGTFPTPQTTKNAPAVTGPGGPNLFADPRAVLEAYDFTLPGDVGQRNGIRGDGFFTIDAGLAKRFLMPFAESHSVQFRWEVFNVTNTARFDPRATSLNLGDRGTFGKYIDMLTTPRVMQFGVRYDF